MPAAESTRHAPARRPSRPSSPRGLVGPGRVQARLPSSTPRYIVTRAGIPSHPRAPSPSSPRRASAPHRATRPGKLTHRGMDQRFHEAYLSQPAHGREAARPGRALPGGARLISRGGAAPTHESRRRDREVGDSWGTDRTAYRGPSAARSLGRTRVCRKFAGAVVSVGVGVHGIAVWIFRRRARLGGQLRPRGNTPALRPLWVALRPRKPRGLGGDYAATLCRPTRPDRCHFGG
jgi:hypothetical protein